MKAERINGPTPSGGAYAVLYRDDDGNPIEGVEYAADGSEILRTYFAPVPALSDDAPAAADS